MKIFKKKGKNNLSDNNSGIFLTNEIRVSPFTCETLPIRMVIMQMILVYAAVSSAISGFITTMEIDASLKVLNILYIVIAIISYFLCTLIRNNRMFWPSLLYFLGVFIIVFFRFGKIVNQTLSAVQMYLDKYNSYFEDSLKITPDNTISSNSTELFIYIGIIVMFITMYVMCCFMNKFMYFLFTLPWVVASFVVGYVPSTVSFFVYIIASFGMWGNSVIKSNYCVRDGRNARKNNTKQKNFKDIAAINIAFTVIILTCIVFCVINLFVRKNSYSESERVYYQKNRLQDRFSEIENNIYALFNGEGGWNIFASSNGDSFFEDWLDNVGFGNGGIARGRFNSSGVSFKDKEKLQVISTDVNDTIYLKAFVGSEYNEGWNMAKDTPSSRDYELTKYCEENSNLYKYGVIEISNLDDMNIDDIVPSVADIDYSVNKKGLINLESNEKAIGFYQIDFDDIYSHCYFGDDSLGSYDYDAGYYDDNEEFNDYYINEVDDELNYEIDEIKQEISDEVSESFDASRLEGIDKFNGTLEVVSCVKDYLVKNYKYNLSPDTSLSLDPVVYFLKRSKEGYCMHFASAATVILQSYGIPTRYVEGYIVTDANFKTGKIMYNKAEDYKNSVSKYEKIDDLDMYQMIVKDANAHAWIEVYMDNIGWVPVEVTGSAINGDSVTDIIRNSYDISTQAPNKTPSPTIKPNQTSKPGESITPKPTVTSKVDNQSQSSSGTGTSGVGENNKKDLRIILKYIINVIIIILIIAVIVITFIMRKRLIVSHNKKVLENKDDTVKYMSKIINRLLQNCNIKYTNNINYIEYASKISDSFDFIDFDSAKDYIELLLKDCFSQYGVSKDDYVVIKDFYNKFVSNLYNDMSNSKKWYYDNIICIIKQI